MSKLVKIFNYTDADDKLLYQNCRFEPKSFRARRPDGNGDFIWDLKGVERTLYRLPEVMQASSQDFISIVEGEADADRLYELGFAATTSGSATSWKPEFAKYFKGRLVCIFYDNDKAGRDYMRSVTDSLYSAAGEIRVIELPGLKESEDVSDWLDNGGTREKLIEIIDSTKPFKPAIETDVRLNLKNMSEVKAEKVEWLWQNKIPDGSLTIISGDPGATKSYLTQYMAAHLTTGTPWPDCPDVPVKKGSVIFIADEDDPAKIIRPRLDAHGADVSRVYILDSVLDGGDKTFFDLTQYMEALEYKLSQIPDCRLLVLDPITAYLGKTNANSNAEVRAAITPLAALASKQNVTIIGINHHNKRQDLSYIHRGLGSTAFVAQARSVWAVVVDKDDSETRIFFPVKSNYCINPTGLKFRIIDGAIEFDTEPWTGHLDDTGKKSTLRVDEATEWLKEKLQLGARLSATLFEEGKEDGFGKDLLYRAKKKLGIKANKDGFGGQWFWQLREGIANNGLFEDIY